MPDGLLLIALPVSNVEGVVAVRRALEGAGLRVAQLAVRETPTAADHDRLVEYFGEDWTKLLGLGGVELVEPAWQRPDLRAVPSDGSAQERP